jgi:hypothetical protein
MRKSLLALLIVVGGLIAGCGGDGTSTTTVTVTESSGGSEADAASPEPAASSVKPLGEAQTIDIEEGGNLTLTALAVDSNPPKPDPRVYELPSGTSWVALEVEVANDSGEASLQSSIEYLLVSDDGSRVVAEGSNAFEPVISCCGGGYNGDSMQPGDKATGFVAFQVPKGFEVDKVRAEATFARPGPVAEWEVD